jgi:hypothetical protein
MPYELQHFLWDGYVNLIFSHGKYSHPNNANTTTTAAQSVDYF